MLEAEVFVKLKKTVADPQGLTVKHALDALGYKAAEEVRMGKLLTIKLDIDDRDKAREELDKMCRELLTNPIIEDYSFDIKGKAK